MAKTSQCSPARRIVFEQVPSLPSKICVGCGRAMTWRKKWERNWDAIKYCSDGCRRRKVGDQDIALESAILSLLADRAADATICPSEAAQRVGGDAWRELMEPARRAARRLQERHLTQIVQGGRPVDPSTARGPIRIRLMRRPG